MNEQREESANNDTREALHTIAERLASDALDPRTSPTEALTHAESSLLKLCDGASEIR